jgi:pseudouridine-5'-phosphate glycosidase
VSATSICAHEAKIPIFCTGGIGGVHRDFVDSMDVSADLQELARTPIAVISSGVKSILDIEKTLEYLETMGVCVVTLEKNGLTDFPSFFTSKSGFQSPFNCKNESEVARLIQTNLKTGFGAGILVGVPIPSQHEADKKLIDDAIREALLDLKREGIKGKRVTPFLLEKINRITKGNFKLVTE